MLGPVASGMTQSRTTGDHLWGLEGISSLPNRCLPEGIGLKALQVTVYGSVLLHYAVRLALPVSFTPSATIDFRPVTSLRWKFMGLF